MNKEKLYLPIAIIIFGILIGSSLLMVQNNKQDSIERQVEMKIAQENKVIKDQKLAESFKRMKLATCLDQADDDYWTYMELNGKGKRYDEEGVTANGRFWDSAEDNKQQDIDNCYR